ncbi:MAG: 2-C-methyl-D-erythritol 2,4-cyclodiphosphate synthase [Victivallaceae bacterium]|nr:2-C-methyl-D-erythritol 2,4-cyclodiphosphate synthase [Victivallaceae bacterium]
MMRIGQGYDVHPFAAGRRLVLGGVEIPYHPGLAGHSDADVAVHALIDALIGALALGDIGHFFPDTDPAYLNIDSMKLLARTLADPRVAEWKIVNFDLTIVAQAPKIAPYREEMRRRLAAACGINIDAASVKATTTEHLGFEGRGEGISAYCVLLLER